MTVRDDAGMLQARSGGTSIKYGFLGRGLDWGGFYRMNGVLKGSDVNPIAVHGSGLS